MLPAHRVSETQPLTYSPSPGLRGHLQTGLLKFPHSVHETRIGWPFFGCGFTAIAMLRSQAPAQEGEDFRAFEYHAARFHFGLNTLAIHVASAAVSIGNFGWRRVCGRIRFGTESAAMRESWKSLKPFAPSCSAGFVQWPAVRYGMPFDLFAGIGISAGTSPQR